MSWSQAIDDAIVHWWDVLVVQHTTHYQRMVIVPAIPLLIIFYSLNALLLTWHFFPACSPIERWRIQEGKRESFGRVAWMLSNVVFNHALTLSLGALNFELYESLGIQTGTEGMPSWPVLAAQIVACMFMYDFFFFLAHRLMHVQPLYRWFHYVHHSSRNSIGLTQSYSHPVDFLLSGLAVLVPPHLVSSHIITQTLWNVVFIIESLNAHTGYNLPFLPDTRVHDFHHSHPHLPANYGAFFSVWDTLLGTDHEYRLYMERKNEKRARMKGAGIKECKKRM